MNESIIKKQVGARIKKYRQINKFTQFKLGELIDINQRQIALIESGKSYPSLSTLLKMTEVFKCNLSDLFADDLQLDEMQLKQKLKDMIENVDYENCKRLYGVIKNFIYI